MANSITNIIKRAISPGTVRSAGPLTVPRSYGVYLLPHNSGATRRFRFGNHPVRMRELEREFGSCKLEHLFLSRAEAMQVAASLNGNKA
jgi:hypothetical protein